MGKSYPDRLVSDRQSTVSLLKDYATVCGTLALRLVENAKLQN